MAEVALQSTYSIFCRISGTEEDHQLERNEMLHVSHDEAEFGGEEGSATGMKAINISRFTR